MSLDFEIEEEGLTYNHKATLQSGDAFLVTSEVKNIKLGVKQVEPQTKPNQLVLRDGSLILTVERE